MPRSQLKLVGNRRRDAKAALIAALLFLAGCGSGKASTSTPLPAAPSSPQSQGPGTISLYAKAVGPRGLSANLTQLIGKDQRPLLKQVKVDCPRARHYPFTCHLTATLSSQGQPPHVVAATVTVPGVYTRTHTYVYQIAGPPR